LVVAQEEERAMAAAEREMSERVLSFMSRVV
jgi:hypothetical protein